MLFVTCQKLSANQHGSIPSSNPQGLDHETMVLKTTAPNLSFAGQLLKLGTAIMIPTYDSVFNPLCLSLFNIFGLITTMTH